MLNLLKRISPNKKLELPITINITPLAECGTILQGESHLFAKSPFSLYHGETSRVIQQKKKISYREMDFLLDKNFIGGIEKEIINAVNLLLFATSRQVTGFLISSGYEVSQELVSRKICKLKEKNILNQIEFVSSNGTSAFKVYRIGHMGIYYIKSNGLYVHMQKFVKYADCVTIKKVLAANQTNIRIVDENSAKFNNSRIIVNKDIDGEIVRASSIIFLEKRNLLIEVVREIPHWEEDFTEKIGRYTAVITNFEKQNILFKSPPILIIQCESFEQMNVAAKLIPRKYKRRIDILFTFDRLLTYDLNKAFYQE